MICNNTNGTGCVGSYNTTTLPLATRPKGHFCKVVSTPRAAEYKPVDATGHKRNFTAVEEAAYNIPCIRLSFAHMQSCVNVAVTNSNALYHLADYHASCMCNGRSNNQCNATPADLVKDQSNPLQNRRRLSVCLLQDHVETPIVTSY